MIAGYWAVIFPAMTVPDSSPAPFDAPALVDATLDRLVASEECVRRIDLRSGGGPVTERALGTRMSRLVNDLDRTLVDEPERCADVLAVRGAELVIVLDQVNAILDLTASDDRLVAACRDANDRHLADLRTALGAARPATHPATPSD